MGEHDPGVRVGLEQMREAPHVGAGLEDPPVAGVPRLQVLELLAMEAVDGAEVGLVVDPVLIAGDPELVVGRGACTSPRPSS